MNKLYEGKDVKWFCGEPKIAPQPDVKVIPYVLKEPKESFMGSYQVQVSRERAVVWDGTVAIASHLWQEGGGSTLVAVNQDPKYANKGIAPNLIALCAKRFPGQRLAMVRSAEGQAAYVAAWPLVQQG